MAALPLLLASASGLVGAVGLNLPGICLAWLHKRGQDKPTKSQQTVIGALFTMSCIASGFIMVGAAASGGIVSILIPVKGAATALGNMIVQMLLGHTYTRDVRLGTIGLSLAVLVLIDVDPQPPPIPSGFAWQARPLTMPSIGILVFADALIIVSVLLTRNQASNSLAKIISTVLLASLSNVLFVTSSKFMGLLSGWQFYCAAIGWAVFSVLNTWGSLLAGNGCDMSMYVPMEIFSRLSLGMLTGILIWNDFDYIESKFAYFTCFLLMLLCVNLTTVQMDLVTAAGNAHKLSQFRLSEGRAHGPIGQAVLDMIQRGAPTTADEVTAFKESFRRSLSCSVQTKVASIDDVLDVVDRFITFNGESAPHVVADWIEEHRLYEKYCLLDPEFQGAFRRAWLNQSKAAKTLWGVQEERISGAGHSDMPV